MKNKFNILFESFMKDLNTKNTLIFESVLTEIIDTSKMYNDETDQEFIDYLEIAIQLFDPETWIYSIEKPYSLIPKKIVKGESKNSAFVSFYKKLQDIKSEIFNPYYGRYNEKKSGVILDLDKFNMIVHPSINSDCYLYNKLITYWLMRYEHQRKRLDEIKPLIETDPSKFLYEFNIIFGGYGIGALNHKGISFSLKTDWDKVSLKPEWLNEEKLHEMCEFYDEAEALAKEVEKLEAEQRKNLESDSDINAWAETVDITPEVRKTWFKDYGWKNSWYASKYTEWKKALALHAKDKKENPEMHKQLGSDSRRGLSEFKCTCGLACKEDSSD